MKIHDLIQQVEVELLTDHNGVVLPEGIAYIAEQVKEAVFTAWKELKIQEILEDGNV